MVARSDLVFWNHMRRHGCRSSIIQVFILVDELDSALLLIVRIDFACATNVAIPSWLARDTLIRALFLIYEWDAREFILDCWQPTLFVKLGFDVDHARLISGLAYFVKFNGSGSGIGVGLTLSLLQDTSSIWRGGALCLRSQHLLEQAILGISCGSSRI